MRSGLEGIVARVDSFSSLVNLMTNIAPLPTPPPLEERKSSIMTGSQEGEAGVDLKALSAKIAGHSAEDSLLSLGEYMRS